MTEERRARSIGSIGSWERIVVADVSAVASSSRRWLTPFSHLFTVQYTNNGFLYHPVLQPLLPKGDILELYSTYRNLLNRFVKADALFLLWSYDFVFLPL